MGEIKDKVELSFLGKNGLEVEAFFDSGTTISVIDREIAKKADLLISPAITSIQTGSGEEIQCNPAFGFIKIKGCSSPLLAQVPIDKKLVEPVVIGVIQMEVMGIQLNPQEKSYSVSCKLPRG